MRMLPYFPCLRIAVVVKFRLKVWSTGRAMLDCPPQYQTSPKVTSVMEAVACVTLHPLAHDTVMV